MDNEKIKRGIAVYQHEQDVFLRLLRKRGSFTEHEFDLWFSGRGWRRKRRVRYLTKDTFILGFGVNGRTLWSEMLELLQIMMELGLVDTRTENGAIVYLPGPNAEVSGAGDNKGE